MFLRRLSAPPASALARRFSSSLASVSVPIRPDQFSPGVRDTVVAETNGLKATAFSFETGVAGLRLENECGSCTMLPFQGQQIWSMEMFGRELTMQSMFDAPRPVDPNKAWGYLDTYGAFFVHCGANAMGIPGEEDDHALHGELPNAIYNEAQVIFGDCPQKGPYIGLQGSYEHVVSFTANWVAQPLVKLYAGGSTVDISMKITNRFHAPMDLMYMAHTNFRPIVGSKLVYSHKAEGMSVSGSVNGLVPPTPEYEAFLEKLAANPRLHNDFSAETLKNLNPEVLVYLHNYVADSEGWAHSLQLLEDGSADYLKHKPAQLDQVVRWMVVDPSHEAFGLALPSTSGPTGKTAERKKGAVRSLGPDETFVVELEAGALGPQEAGRAAAAVERLLDG